MVVKKSSSSLQIQKSPIVQNTKSYLKTAFSSALTVSPFDVENTKFSYFQPISLLSLISSMSSIFSLLIIPIDLNTQQYLISFVISHLITLAFYSLSTYLFAFFGCKILGLEYSSQHFGIVASSLIPVPLLMLVGYLKIEALSYAAYLAIVLIMPYYINSTYQRYFTMGTERTKFFYGVYGFICFIIILKFAESLTLASIPLSIIPKVLKSEMK